MRKRYLLLFLTVTLACNNANKKDGKDSNDSTLVDSSIVIDTPKTDINLIELNKKILNSIKTKDYRFLANNIHPTLGLRLSPYATVSVSNDVVIKPAELIKMIKEDKKLYWGNYDGTGDPIDLSTADYFANFVYDVDFINAEKVTLNRSIATGNSVNNINSVYPQCDFVENYFSGFNKKYEGMDWRALRLVFQKEGSRYYLLGIVHDQWTI
jgi:hypothetical protein